MHVSIPFPKCMKTIMCANHLFMSMGAKENKSICKVVLKIKGGQFSYSKCKLATHCNNRFSAEKSKCTAEKVE